MNRNESRTLATANTRNQFAPLATVTLPMVTIDTIPHNEATYCTNFNQLSFDGFNFNGVNSWKTVSHERAIPNIDGMDELEAVYTLGISKAIVISCLKKLWAYGNETARQLMYGHNGIFSIDDLEQELLITLQECRDSWRLEDNKLIIDEEDTDTIKAIYGTVSRFMYSFAIRHYKHEYISIDDEDVRTDNVSALASHVDINEVLGSVFIEDFRNTLTLREDAFLTMRVKGYTLAKIAEKLDVSMKAVRTIEKHVRQKWDDFNN